MQPDAFGLAFATAVLVFVLAIFGLVARIISGPVDRLCYSFGRDVARGLAWWSAKRRVRPASSSSVGA